MSTQPIYNELTMQSSALLYSASDVHACPASAASAAFFFNCAPREMREMPWSPTSSLLSERSSS